MNKILVYIKIHFHLKMKPCLVIHRASEGIKRQCNHLGGDTWCNRSGFVFGSDGIQNPL